MTGKDDFLEHTQGTDTTSNDGSSSQDGPSKSHDDHDERTIRADGGFDKQSPWKSVPDQVSTQRDILLVLSNEQLGAETIRTRLAPRYRLFLTDSQFFPALNDLVQRSLVRCERHDDEKEYALTEAGRQAVSDHLEWIIDVAGSTLAEKDHLIREATETTSATDDPEMENPGLDAFTDISSSTGNQGGIDDEQ